MKSPEPVDKETPSRLLARAATLLDEADQQEMMEVVRHKWELTRKINRISSNEPGRDINWFTDDWPSQSRCFVIDVFPTLQELILRSYKRKDTITLLDVGAATGAGSSLLGELFSGHMLWCQIKVDAIDLSDRRILFAMNNYQHFEYRIGNVFDLEEQSYDIVLCSHVVEHVQELQAFIQQLRRIARNSAIIYAPYNETDRISGHLNTITEATFSAHSPKDIRVVRSLGWRPGHPDYKCIIAVVPGGSTESGSKASGATGSAS